MIAALLVSTFGVSALAQVTGFHICQVRKPADVLPGFRTFDLSIDFVGEYSGSQILFELSSGSFYQDPIGSDSPPNERFFEFFPDLAYDTFFAQGGPTAGTTVGTLGVGGGGGPVDIDPSLTDLLVNSTRLQAQFNPSGADFIADRTNFLIARITLSDDANGTFTFFSSANGDIPDLLDFAFVDGTIGVRFCSDIPEPAGMALMATLGLGLLPLRRVR
ncbi:MAG: hypothetical protein AAF328_09180 [Planctomycetota bacterium]